jgi:hypothetical protein
MQADYHLRVIAHVTSVRVGIRPAASTPALPTNETSHLKGDFINGRIPSVVVFLQNENKIYEHLQTFGVLRPQ